MLFQNLNSRKNEFSPLSLPSCNSSRQQSRLVTNLDQSPILPCAADTKTNTVYEYFVSTVIKHLPFYFIK